MNSRLKEYALRTIKTLMLPVIVYVFFCITGEGNFGSLESMLVIARQSCMPILLSFAIAFNMSIGLWDFSVGAAVWLCCILAGNLTNTLGFGLPGLIIFCLLVGLMLGTLTGLLYNFMKVPSMVLTIGLVLVFEALTCLLFDGRGALITGKMTMLYQAPYCFVILAFMMIIFYIVLNYTTFGHNVRAIGNGQLTARNAGLNIAKTKLMSFMFGGFFLGVASLLYISQKGRLGAVSDMQSVITVFDAMMGIFIGMFLSKYCNLTFGVAIGAFTIKMLNTGLVAMGLSSNVRNISNGLFLLIILIISNNQGIFARLRDQKARIAEAKAKFKEESATE